MLLKLSEGEETVRHGSRDVRPHGNVAVDVDSKVANTSRRPLSVRTFTRQVPRLRGRFVAKMAHTTINSSVLAAFSCNRFPFPFPPFHLYTLPVPGSLPQIQLGSGGARVFAARGKRLYCRPPPITSSCYAVDSFHDFGHWGVNQLLGSPPLPSPLLLPHLLLYPFPFPPLKV